MPQNLLGLCGRGQDVPIHAFCPLGPGLTARLEGTSHPALSPSHHTRAPRARPAQPCSPRKSLGMQWTLLKP